MNLNIENKLKDATDSTGPLSFAMWIKKTLSKTLITQTTQAITLDYGCPCPISNAKFNCRHLQIHFIRESRAHTKHIIHFWPGKKPNLSHTSERIFVSRVFFLFNHPNNYSPPRSYRVTSAIWSLSKGNYVSLLLTKYVRFQKKNSVKI